MKRATQTEDLISVHISQLNENIISTAHENDVCCPFSAKYTPAGFQSETYNVNKDN